MKYLIAFMIICTIISCNNDIEPGTNSLSGKIISESGTRGPVVVRLYKLTEYDNGRVASLSKADIYGAKAPVKVTRADSTGSYLFTNLEQGYYSIVAFCDADKDGEISFDPPDPFGWYSIKKEERIEKIKLEGTDIHKADFLLRLADPFPAEDIVTEHGSLVWKKGLPVLQLSGTPAERGYAHGYLVGKQIIDFFEFYLLEDSWISPEKYSNVFVPFIENNMSLPEGMVTECDAVIEGMKASGTDMFVKLLGREFTRTDLVAINAYIERRASFPGLPAESCTQFAFWGERSQEGRLSGGLVAARNMDGECDLRKVTVSHFLLFAVDPADENKKRWVSAMWPGFVGTISGMNEEGLYCMENAGGSGSGPVPTGVVPCSWIQREALEQQGAGATPESIMDHMKRFKSSGGGITAAGSIILWAVPYNGQSAPAFVFEGARTGSSMRHPTDVRPVDSFNIMASNHHRVLGFDQAYPDRSLGREVSFSSLWRYEAGMQKLEAWSRQKRMDMDVEDAIDLLRTVAHGTTEYSVIFSASEMKIYVAVDDLETDMWDAPYQPFTEFGFDELFDNR